MMKKATGILLLCALCLSVFAAGGKEPAAAKSGDVKVLQWWDHFAPFAALHQKLWAEYEAKTGIKVEHTVFDPAKQNDAELLAFRSGQMPDVFSMTFGAPRISSMQKEGWFSPLDLNVGDLPDYVRNSLFEGYTLFNGKVYSFPTINNFNHNVVTWYLKEPVEKAGYTKLPASFDEVRAVAKKITQDSGGKVYGVVLPIAFIQRMNDTMADWAFASGGMGSIDWKTGEYQYASQQYFDIFEFLTGLKDDGSVHPASVNMNMRQARERWAAGEGAILFDGSWNIGMVRDNFSQILNSVAVGETLRKNTSLPYKIYRSPPVGTFYISGQSKGVKQATEILKMFTTDEYYIGVAERMDQPPLKLDAVKKANVHPTYIQTMDLFAKEMAYQPDPILKNPAVGDVYAEMKDLHPNPAEILQGYYAGALKDWKGELRKYNAAITAERERAIKAVQAKGVKVSIDDFKFPNWSYGMNYTTDKYK